MFNNDNKYIVVGNSIDGRIDDNYDEIIFPFSRNINHSYMFKLVKRARYDTLVSAGFIDEFMNCYGSSMTLRVSSRPEDTELLHRFFRIDDKKLTYK